MKQNNRIILITGAGQGLGKAITEILAEDNIVFAADIKSEQVTQIAKDLQQKGYQVRPLSMDVSSQENTQKGIQTIMQEFGRIDVLINNAGIDATKSIEELSIEEWDRVLGVNLRGPFLLSKHVFPIMKEQKKGHIINITSTAAKRTWPNATAYHASKWGLLGFSHALLTEARQFGIKVSALVAGGMRTPFILERFPDTPLDVLQDPKNVAQAIKFLLSQPEETVIPEVMVIPMKETSWP